MNSIEEKIWNYIDGNCSAEDEHAIKHLIATDELYHRKYEELTAMNNELAALELDEPSMGFTFKVMEAVRSETAAIPLKSSINKAVVRGLVGIFLVIITSLVIYAMFSINWSAGGHGGFGSITLPDLKMPNMKPATSNFIIKAFVFFDTVLLLFFADSYLRRQRSSKQV